MTPQKRDELVKKHSAFGSFAELVQADGNYRPSLDVSDTERLALANAYDLHMRASDDMRRAYRYGAESPGWAGNTWSRELNQAVRYGTILAVLGREVMWIYQMPAGRQFIGIDGPGDKYRAQSLNSMPKKWQAAIASQGGVLSVDDALDALGWNVTERHGRVNTHEQERREWARANRVPAWVLALPCNQPVTV